MEGTKAVALAGGACTSPSWRWNQGSLSLKANTGQSAAAAPAPASILHALEPGQEGTEEGGQRGGQGRQMASWQAAGGHQLAAKYLMRPFAVTQLAWPPWSNEVSCTCATAPGLLHGCCGAGGCCGAALLPPSLLHSPPAPHAPAGSRAPHARAPHAGAQHRAQRRQPRGCFTTRGRLSPMKYICGSERGDKLLNCVCGRFMVRRDAGEGWRRRGGPCRQP